MTSIVKSNRVTLPINEHNLTEYKKLGITIPENVTDLNSCRIKLPEGWKVTRLTIREDIVKNYAYDASGSVRFSVIRLSSQYTSEVDQLVVNFFDSKTGKKIAKKCKKELEKKVQQEIQSKKDKIEVIEKVSAKYKPEKPHGVFFSLDLRPCAEWGIKGYPDHAKFCAGFFATEDLANKALAVVKNELLNADPLRINYSGIEKITEENKATFYGLKHHPGLKEGRFSLTRYYLSVLKSCC